MMRTTFSGPRALAAIGTGLFPVRLNVFPVRLNVLVSIGFIDLLRFYGRSPTDHYVPSPYAAAILWVLILVGLGFLARRGHRWAFFAGIFLYAADILVLIMTFSLLASGLHAFFLFRWFQGQKALGDLNDPGASARI
jgi:hypothetical protein